MTTNYINQSKTSNPPNEKWRSSANEFVQHCEDFLWGKVGLQALKYLRSLRLDDGAIRKYHTGYNPKDDFEFLEAWGLPIAYNAKGNQSKVWLPRGIVIPCIVDNVIRSIKIRRYLTEEQKAKGELADYTVKGSVPGLFGAENLRGASFALLVDNEFDVLLLDQCAGDIAEVASFGRTAKAVGAPEWTSWGRYLLPLTYILVPTSSSEEEKIIITDSLPVYSRRTHFAQLPDHPNVRVLTDLRKAGVDPKDWLIQALNSLLASEKHPAVGVSEHGASVEVSDQVTDAEPINDVHQTQQEIIIDLNEHRFVDITIMPAYPCYACRNDEYWQRPVDHGWVCSTCHPNPSSQSINEAILNSDF